MAPQSGPPFTPFGTDQPDTSSFNAMMSSLLDNNPTSIPFPSQNTAVSTQQSVETASPAPTSTSSGNPSTFATSTVFSSSGSSQTPSITSNSTSPSAKSATSAPSATSGTSTSTATNAASNSDGSVTVSECHSVSCSSGLQAAVAVPVVVGTLAILALILFLVRRRKKPTTSKASRSEKPKKKWTRHLKIFSFDTEILGGGRFSSSNSMRSGGSSQHINDSHQREVSSLHSTDDAAPPYPYRDVVSHSHQPNMTQVGTGIVAGTLASNGIPRSTSRASAPPPYSGQAENAPQHTSGALVSDDRDPFSDPSPNANPAILINESSPFRDPSEDGSSTHSRPGISRASSMRTGLDADEVSMVGGSDTGSIREAQIGRHVSVASGGRTITHVRNSGSPANSETNVPT